MTEAELAEHHNRTQETWDFDEAEEVPVTVKRNVSISVRFSDTEFAGLRARVEQAGVKVASFIRAAAAGGNECGRPRLRSASLPLTSSAARTMSPS